MADSPDLNMHNIDLDQIWPFPQHRLKPEPARTVAAPDTTADEMFDQAAYADAAYTDTTFTDTTFGDEGYLDGAYVDTQAYDQFQDVYADSVSRDVPQALPELTDAPHLAPESRDIAASTVPQTSHQTVPQTGHQTSPQTRLHERTNELASKSTVGAKGGRGVTPARRDFTPLLWGGLGFVAGIVSWHFIGFWSFMSNVVLNADEPQATQVATTRASDVRTQDTARRTVNPITTGSINTSARTAVGTKNTHVKLAGRLDETASLGPKPSDDAVCMTLSLDRKTGMSMPDMCLENPAPELRDAGYIRRDDRLALRPRLQDPAAWRNSTAIAASTIRVEPPPPIEPIAVESTAAEPAAVKAAVKSVATTATAVPEPKITPESEMDYGTLQPSDLKIDIE